MCQHLEIKGLVALVAHVEHGLQAVLAQRDAVLQAEVEGPRLAHVVGEVVGREAKVEAHGVVAALGQRAGLGRRLAQILPARDAREAVLRQRRCRVVLWWWTEDLLALAFFAIYVSTVPCLQVGVVLTFGVSQAYIRMHIHDPGTPKPKTKNRGLGKQARTGNTTGIPPLTAFLPSRLAAELSQRLSLPLVFQEMTVAPYRSTSTESPLGSVAVTLWPSDCTDG